MLVAALLVTVAACSLVENPPPKDISAFASGRLELTSVRPEVTRSFTIDLHPRGEAYEAVAELVVDVLPVEGREPVEITLVRSSDGARVELGPFREAGQLAAIGRSFTPFGTCEEGGACREGYAVTFRLVGTEPVTAEWRAQTLVTFEDWERNPGPSAIHVTID